VNVSTRAGTPGGRNGSKVGPGRTPAAVWILSVAMGMLSLTWSLLTPQFLAPDESAHFASTMRVSQGFSWPDPGAARFPAAVEAAQAQSRMPHEDRSSYSQLLREHPGDGARVDQMTQHPPLYYLITGAVAALPGTTEMAWDNIMLLIRGIGAVFAVPLVWLAWAAVGTLLRSRKAGLIAAVAVFAVPQLAQTMGVVTNDSLAILLAWTTTWLAVRVLRGDRRFVTIILLGTAFGVAALTKGTTLPLGALVAIVPFVGSALPSIGRRWRDAALVVAVATLVGGWWWARNLILFGRLQPDGIGLEASAPPNVPDPSLGHYIDEVWNTTPTTFWGWFGRVNVPLPELVVDFLTISCVILLAAGLVIRRDNRASAFALLLPVAGGVVLFIGTSWAAYDTTGDVRGLHGRYFFTLMLALLGLGAIATTNVARDLVARRALAACITGLASLLAIGGLVMAFIGFYADNTYGQWRSGLRLWLGSFSPMPSWFTIVVPVAFVAVFLTGVIATWVHKRRSAGSLQAQTSP